MPFPKILGTKEQLPGPSIAAAVLIIDVLEDAAHLVEIMYVRASP
jgi:hypothetical protein